MTVSLEGRIVGCLVGGAIGDAMGLPFEGSEGPLEYVPPDTWSISDDTQLTLATCEAIANDGRVSPESISEVLSKWFRDGRFSGIGASTLKALRELDAGGHWALVGRKGEMAAGNGAAMRAAPLGFMLHPDNHSDRVVLRDVCRITHHSDEAYAGALAVVAAIHCIAFKQQSPRRSLLSAVHRLLPDSNVKDRILELRDFSSEKTIQDCGEQFGTSGYVADSVPLALAAVTYIPQLGFQAVLEGVVECGGDTDTIASITGQIAGTFLGVDNLPPTLVRHIEDVGNMQSLALQLLEHKKLPYTRLEVTQLSEDSWPNRGEFCESCHAWIPKFADISEDEVSRLRSLDKMQAMKQLKEKTGCSLRWAKIWAMHPNGPESRYVGPPCPHCGEPLRTERAQQCLSCGADWH